MILYRSMHGDIVEHVFWHTLSYTVPQKSQLVMSRPFYLFEQELIRSFSCGFLPLALLIARLHACASLKRGTVAAVGIRKPHRGENTIATPRRTCVGCSSSSVSEPHVDSVSDESKMSAGDAPPSTPLVGETHESWEYCRRLPYCGGNHTMVRIL